MIGEINKTGYKKKGTFNINITVLAKSHSAITKIKISFM